MGRGMGRVQRACLRVVEQYERDGRWPTTFNIAAEVYAVPPDQDSIRCVTDAQHVAVKRALAGLQRHGLVIGFRTGMQRSPGVNGRTELCHHWMTETRLMEWLASEKRPIEIEGQTFGLTPDWRKRVESIERKARAIGMRVPAP